MPILPLLLLFFHFAPQASAQPPTLPPDADARVLETRALKDSVLRHASDSPLLAADRQNFKNLAYFPLDPAYRFVGELHLYGRPQQIELPTNADETITMQRYARLLWRPQAENSATAPGKAFSFEVYRNLQSETLEVFFTDDSNGQQTYGGGRYVPISPLGDGYYLLDFNMAYNPYCAYNPEYVCPMPPPQNHLPFAVLAGEKAYGMNLAD